MFAAITAALTAIATAFGKIADAAAALVTVQRQAQQQELGQLRQANAALTAENGTLHARLAALEALMAKPAVPTGAAQL